MSNIAFFMNPPNASKCLSVAKHMPEMNPGRQAIVWNLMWNICLESRTNEQFTVWSVYQTAREKACS
jgi:hypothetical protein